MYSKNVMKRHFPVIVEQDSDGVFILTCPAIRGCHSYGQTLDEGIRNITEAIQVCLEESSDDGETRFIGVRDVELMA